jgi:hypothetical protein
VSVVLLQLALLLIAIGVLLFILRIVRSSPNDDLKKPSRFLHGGFWGCVLSFAVAMGVDQLFTASDAGPNLPGVISALFLAAFYVFACFYWTSLGVLADRIGRNSAIWVVAGLATLAFGFIVSYILMSRHVRNELARREDWKATVPPVGRREQRR